MNRILSTVSLVALAPLLANCNGGNVVLQPQNTNLLVAPDSVVLSASAPTSIPFGVADKAVNGGSITLSQGTCSGIATYGSSVASHAAHTMTIGSNPGVNAGGNASGYSVSPLAPGVCTLRLDDAAGNMATIFVTVTK